MTGDYEQLTSDLVASIRLGYRWKPTTRTLRSNSRPTTRFEVTGAGPGHPGELYAKSTMAFDEYYKQLESYRAAMHDGFHTVGDIAYRDSEGFYYICDRKNDMIISGSMNVYPAEVEAALEQHPGIFDAAVFGTPCEQ